MWRHLPAATLATLGTIFFPDCQRFGPEFQQIKTFSSVLAPPAPLCLAVTRTGIAIFCIYLLNLGSLHLLFFHAQ